MTFRLGRVGRALGVPAFVVLVPGLLMARATAAITDPPVPPKAAPTAVHTQAECADLLKQFDVAWPTHREAKRAAEGQQARDEGASACSAGHYSDGVKALHRALHAIGVKPVKLAPPAHP